METVKFVELKVQRHCRLPMTTISSLLMFCMSSPIQTTHKVNFRSRRLHRAILCITEEGGSPIQWSGRQKDLWHMELCLSSNPRGYYASLYPRTSDNHARIISRRSSNIFSMSTATCERESLSFQECFIDRYRPEMAPGDTALQRICKAA